MTPEVRASVYALDDAQLGLQVNLPCVYFLFYFFVRLNLFIVAVWISIMPMNWRVKTKKQMEKFYLQELKLMNM